MNIFELTVTREGSETEWKIQYSAHDREGAIAKAVADHYVVKAVRLIEDGDEASVYHWLKVAAVVWRVLSWIYVAYCAVFILYEFAHSVYYGWLGVAATFEALLLGLCGVILSYVIEGFGLLVRNSK